MGITGLIPFLEKASSRIHLSDLRDSCVAVDTYCWLHKGVFGCAEKLVRGEETDLYIQYCLKYVQMLLTFNIKPILVFDGQHLPAKALTEKRRRESRQQSKKRATELLRLGRVDEARSQMRRCVDVTHEMALRLIQACRKLNVDCIVAPYEADAQMAWFSKTSIAQYIITEDSDLALFGARNVIFKLDLTGNGLLLESEKLYLAMGCRQEKYTFEKFRRMCILSGCDYLDSLPGIGLAKACKFILKTEQEDMWKALKKIPQYLNMRNLEVDESYIENFLKAEATFRHMYIYNPLNRQMERLYALSDYETEQHLCSNAGTLLDDNEKALQLALGNLDPFTLKQLDSWHPDHSFRLKKTQGFSSKRSSNHKSIWQPNFTSLSTSSLGAKKVITSQRDTCALFFKKVDFISKSLDAEIEANIRSEQSKPEESEVFTIYQSTVKRRRLTSSSSTRERTPPTSPAPTMSRHNPFIKDKTIDELQRSPAVCENGSLLRLLSPKKERTVGATTEQSHRTTEVRSRFFAANVRDVMAQQVRSASNDRRDKKDELEKQVKECKYLKDLVNNENEREDFQESTLQRRTDSADKCVTNQLAEVSANDAVQPNCLDTSILISDESSDNCNSQNRHDEQQEINSSSINFKTMPTKSFKCFSPGLSKHKSKTKGVKKGFKLIDSGQNQTRLSMFGFQKRPTL